MEAALQQKWPKYGAMSSQEMLVLGVLPNCVWSLDKYVKLSVSPIDKVTSLSIKYRSKLVF